MCKQGFSLPEPSRQGERKDDATQAATAEREFGVPAVRLGDATSKALSGNEAMRATGLPPSSGQCRPKSADAGPRMASMQTGVLCCLCMCAHVRPGIFLGDFFRMVLVVVGCAAGFGVMRGMILGGGMRAAFPLATVNPTLDSC